MGQKLKADNSIWRMARFLAGPFFRSKFKIKTYGEMPAPPFILIANHVSFWDVFLLGALIKYPVAWVTARGVFENPFLKHLVQAVGAIPKRKARPDIQTIREIIHVLKQGGAVGLFPEGNITWDGSFGYLYPGTDKLLDKLKVAVVGVKIKGAWLNQPRWADKNWGGPVEIEFASFEDSRALDFIKHNEWQWQKTKKLRSDFPNKALGINRIIWFCTLCGGFLTIKPLGNTVFCTTCKKIDLLDEYGYLSGQDTIEILQTQLAFLKQYITSFKVIKVAEAWAQIRREGTNKAENIKGELLLYNDRLLVGNRVFLLQDIKRSTTFMRKILEFHQGSDFVRIKLKDASLLICKSIELLQGE